MAEKPVVVATSGAQEGPLLIVHGGAGIRRHPYTAERDVAAAAALERALDAGMEVLDAGGTALDAAVAAVRVLEDDQVFNAGRGAALTSAGTAELDACVMRGDGSAGAVTGVTCARNPVEAARAVMERTGHVLVCAPGPELLATWGVDVVENGYFVTERRQAELAELRALPDGGWRRAEGHGTVGAVARDERGEVCAATSTGGMANQLPGRVGDSPVCGAGTYANAATCAISCTGTGEQFMRESAGYQVHARMLWGGQDAGTAAASTLEAVESRGGDGGIICVPVRGEGVVARSSLAQMDWAWAHGTTRRVHT